MRGRESSWEAGAISKAGDSLIHSKIFLEHSLCARPTGSWVQRWRQQARPCSCDAMAHGGGMKGSRGLGTDAAA